MHKHGMPISQNAVAAWTSETHDDLVIELLNGTAKVCTVELAIARWQGQIWPEVLLAVLQAGYRSGKCLGEILCLVEAKSGASSWVRLVCVSRTSNRPADSGHIYVLALLTRSSLRPFRKLLERL